MRAVRISAMEMSYAMVKLALIWGTLAMILYV
jgi:hypothetical protein